MFSQKRLILSILILMAILPIMEYFSHEYLPEPFAFIPFYLFIIFMLGFIYKTIVKGVVR